MKMNKYGVSYKNNEVYQGIEIIAPDEATAIAFFQQYKPTATIYGATINPPHKPGKPCLQVPDDFEI